MQSICGSRITSPYILCSELKGLLVYQGSRSLTCIRAPRDASTLTFPNYGHKISLHPTTTTTTTTTPINSKKSRSLSYNVFSGFPELRQSFNRKRDSRNNNKKDVIKPSNEDVGKCSDLGVNLDKEVFEKWPWSKSKLFQKTNTYMNLKTDPVAKQELPRDNRSIIDYAFKNDPLFKPLESKAKHEKVYQHNHGGITLRCTEFNSVGDITVRAGEFSKIELCNEHGLQPRDLRRLDSHFVNQMPGILVRQKAILVNLLHIKAIIESDKLILFDAITMANDYDHGVLVRELQERLKEGAGKKSTGLPFEFRALESVLISVVERLQSDEEVLLNLVQNLLAYLEESVDRTKLRELLQYSKRLSRFEQRAGNIRDALEELLDNDEDLEDMYLSAKLSNEACETNDHEEIELLLETYLMRVEEVVNHIESVASHVRTTEDVVNIILDAQRNSLLLLEIKLTIFTLSLSAGTFITSIFGMNLLNTYEGNPYGFTIVTGAAGALGAILGVLGIRKMRSVLRRLK